MILFKNIVFFIFSPIILIIVLLIDWVRDEPIGKIRLWEVFLYSLVSHFLILKTVFKKGISGTFTEDFFKVFFEYIKEWRKNG